MNKFVEKIRKCFKKESYNDEGVYKINFCCGICLNEKYCNLTIFNEKYAVFYCLL